MGELVVTRGSIATPDTVWGVLTDLDTAASTISEIEKIEHLDGGAFDVAISWRGPRTMFVRTATRY